MLPWHFTRYLPTLA